MMLHFTFVVITGNPQAAISAALFGQGSIMLGEIPTSREEQNSGKHYLLIHRRKIVSKPPGFTVDSKKDITPVLSILHKHLRGSQQMPQIWLPGFVDRGG